MKALYFTNKGKVRKNNEDALLILSEVFSEENFSDCKQKDITQDSFIVAVADGMGGHEKGEVASKIVLETLKQLSPLKTEEDIRNVLNTARQKLEDYAKEHSDAFGLGCAVAGMIVNAGNSIAFNVGDCRVYRYINNKLIKLTRDHSVVEELVLDGIISRQEARVHPKRNVLTSAIIGDGNSTELNIFTTEVNMDLGGIFLICSDGLWDELEDEEIQKCISSNNPCEEFLNVINTKPLRDNVSFIILL